MSVVVALLGAPGRMGVALLSLIAQAPDLTLSGALVRAGHPWEGEDVGIKAGVGPLGVLGSASLPAVLAGADVVVDFSAPALLGEALPHLIACDLPLVTGTTGLGPEGDAALKRAGAHIPILAAANFSVGVTALLALVRQASAALGPEFEGEILELHHRHKKDSPSGTALALGEALAGPRGAALEAVEVYRGRGETGPRQPGEVGMAALRGADVVGEHTVYFFGEGERLELSHRATDRRIFARGALRGARWLLGRAPGIYAMTDVLGL